MISVGRILDGSRFLEFKTMFGESLVCGFGRLSGQLVGVLINAGNIMGADAQKGKKVTPPPLPFPNTNTRNYLSILIKPNPEKGNSL